MSNDECPKKRIDQWFVRGIGVVIASIFLTVMTFTLLDLQQGLFFTEGTPSVGLDYILLIRQIGQYLWTFRILDLILVLIILVLIIISTSYIMNFKTQEIRKNQDRGRYR